MVNKVYRSRDIRDDALEAIVSKPQTERTESEPARKLGKHICLASHYLFGRKAYIPTRTEENQEKEEVRSGPMMK